MSSSIGFNGGWARAFAPEGGGGLPTPPISSTQDLFVQQSTNLFSAGFQQSASYGSVTPPVYGDPLNGEVFSQVTANNNSGNSLYYKKLYVKGNLNGKFYDSDVIFVKYGTHPTVTLTWDESNNHYSVLDEAAKDFLFAAIGTTIPFTVSTGTIPDSDDFNDSDFNTEDFA